MEKVEKGPSTTLTAHGDGTYSTQSGYDAKKVQHESIGAALMHLAKLHSEGDHMHIHGTDDGFTTHHVMEGGSVEGPDEHKSVRALKQHVSKTMNEGGDGY